MKYWTRTETLGLGVSAHELWRERRRANVSRIEGYLAGIGEGRRPLALDRPVPPGEADRERVFLGLRLSDGVPAGWLEPLLEADATLRADYGAWIEAGVLEARGDRVAFSERGIPGVERGAEPVRVNYRPVIPRSVATRDPFSSRVTAPKGVPRAFGPRNDKVGSGAR